MTSAGDVDTVIVAFTDMQGRLVGKRVFGPVFVDEVAATAPNAAVTCWRSTST